MLLDFLKAMLAFLQENGAWLGAFGVLALAVMTFFILRQNRVLTLRGYQVELVALVIDPLLDRVKAVKNILSSGRYGYHECELKQAEQVFGTETDVSIFQVARDLYLIPDPALELKEKRYLDGFEAARLTDLEEDHQNLVKKIDEFDQEAPSFRKLLGELAQQVNHVLRSVGANDWESEDIPYLTKVILGRLFEQGKDFPHLVSGFFHSNAMKEHILRTCEEQSAVLAQVLDDTTVLSLRKEIQLKVGSLQNDLVELEEKLLKTRRGYTKKHGITEYAIAQAKEQYRDRMSLGRLI